MIERRMEITGPQEVGDDERKTERQSQGREKNQDQNEGGKRD